MQRRVLVSQHTDMYEHTQSYVHNELSDTRISLCSVMNWTGLCVKGKERKSMMISECQCYITACVSVHVCVYVCEKSFCLMKFAGDLEISPICGILWSSISHPSLSLSLSFPSQIWSWGRLVQLRCLCTGKNVKDVLSLSKMLLKLFCAFPKTSRLSGFSISVYVMYMC